MLRKLNKFGQIVPAGVQSDPIPNYGYRLFKTNCGIQCIAQGCIEFLTNSLAFTAEKENYCWKMHKLKN